MDGILEVLTNPFILFLISVPVFVLLGILIGTWLGQPRKPRVLKIQPESGRGEELEVDHEDTVNVYCEPITKTPPQRFIKRHQAFNIMRKGWLKLSTYPLWFGRQGTAYTQTFEGNPSSEPVKVTLREAIYNIFGKELYERIPNEAKTGYIKDQIESSSVGVLVEFPKSSLTPEGLPSISSDDVRRNDVDTFISSLVRGIKSLSKGERAGEWIKIIFILGSGIAIGIVLSLVFHWGAPTVVQTPTATPSGG